MSLPNTFVTQISDNYYDAMFTPADYLEIDELHRTLNTVTTHDDLSIVTQVAHGALLGWYC